MIGRLRDILRRHSIDIVQQWSTRYFLRQHLFGCIGNCVSFGRRQWLHADHLVLSRFDDVDHSGGCIRRHVDGWRHVTDCHGRNGTILSRCHRHERVERRFRRPDLCIVGRKCLIILLALVRQLNIVYRHMFFQFLQRLERQIAHPTNLVLR